MQVLIVHLQRFEYPGLKPVKVNADVTFDNDLELLPSMFAHTAPRKRARYGLIAVVNHHGAQSPWRPAWDDPTVILFCRSE